MIPALVLQVVAVAHVVVAVHQLASLHRLDFGGPVVAIQKGLEILRVWRIRLLKWSLLLGPLLWLPLLIVTLEAVLGADTYRADRKNLATAQRALEDLARLEASGGA